jgi:hypothetical protein
VYSPDIRIYLERELSGAMQQFGRAEPGSVAWHEVADRVRELRRLIADQEVEAARAEAVEERAGGVPVAR